MRHAITATLVTLVVVGSLVLPARGGIISGTITGDSTLTPTSAPGVYLQNFTGGGNDTTYGEFTSASHSTIDFSKPPTILISNGSFTETFSQGTLFGTEFGSGTASGAGTATVSIDFVFTGGTGFFVWATGDATLTATITSTGATTESITGSYVGTLSIVPEPSSLTLLASAVAAGAVVTSCRRNREKGDAMARPENG